MFPTCCPTNDFKRCLYWYKCITTIVDWLNMIFYWLLRHSDGTHVNEPSKDKSMDGVNVDDISGMFNKKLTIDDNSKHSMSSSTLLSLSKLSHFYQIERYVQFAKTWQTIRKMWLNF
jgi:hypothetical protein